MPKRAAVTPPALVPRLPGRPVAGVQKSATVAPRGRAVAQLFAVDNVNYGNLDHLDTKKLTGKKLYEKVCEDATFTNQEDAVKARLKQYVSIYPDKDFTLALLKDYLQDDIFRQKIPLDAQAEWTAQTLLTTQEGLKRIRGTAQVQQAFPAGEEIRFYRTMGFANFAEMLGVDPGGKTTRQVVRQLPYENTNIKDRISDTTKLGNHAGDYKQAWSYFGNANEAQVFLEFKFDVSTFFSPDNLALPKDGSDDLKTVLANKFKNRVYQQTTNQAEGTHANLPGIKSENRGLYSVGLSTPAMAKFIANASSVKVLQYHIP
jgi:hypothetical protein